MIYLSVPSVPPSANNAYFNLPRGGRALTKEGTKYKNETIAYLSQTYREKLLFFKKDAPYIFAMRLWFEAIENKGWPKTADSRYKKLDASNRIKLFEDALKAAAGVDDSQFLTVIVQKCQGEPRTDVWVWNTDEEESSFDAILAGLSSRL